MDATIHNASRELVNALIDFTQDPTTKATEYITQVNSYTARLSDDTDTVLKSVVANLMTTLDANVEQYLKVPKALSDELDKEQKLAE